MNIGESTSARIVEGLAHISEKEVEIELGVGYVFYKSTVTDGAPVVFKVLIGSNVSRLIHAFENEVPPRLELILHFRNNGLIMYVGKIGATAAFKVAPAFVGCELKPVEAIESSHIVYVPLKFGKTKLLPQGEHT